MRGTLAASRSRAPTMTARAGGGEARAVLGIGEEGEVRGPRGIERGHAGERHARLADGFSAQARDDFPKCQRSQGGLLVRQGLDDLVGDVDARAREDGLLDDEVELLLLGDLVDDARRTLLDAGELLVAAQVEVLADLALDALEV